MAQVNIKGSNPQTIENRRKILQQIEDTLTDEQLDRLGKIAQSSTAKQYLGPKYMMLKTFLKLK